MQRIVSGYCSRTIPPACWLMLSAGLQEGKETSVSSVSVIC